MHALIDNSKPGELKEMSELSPGHDEYEEEYAKLFAVGRESNYEVAWKSLASTRFSCGHRRNGWLRQSTELSHFE